MPPAYGTFPNMVASGGILLARNQVAALVLGGGSRQTPARYSASSAPFAAEEAVSRCLSARSPASSTPVADSMNGHGVPACSRRLMGTYLFLPGGLPRKRPGNPPATKGDGGGRAVGRSIDQAVYSLYHQLTPTLETALPSNTP